MSQPILRALSKAEVDQEVIVGFGTEILFLIMLGLVVLGPTRMHSMLGYLARPKAELDKANQGIKSQISAQLQHASQEGENSSADASRG